MSNPLNERRFKSSRDARMAKLAKAKNLKMGGTKEYRRVGGRLKLTSVSSATRRSRRMAGKRLRRISRTAGAKRVGKMTRRLNKRFGESATTHSPAFLAAINTYVAQSGRPDIGAALAETIDPRLTNTPVGLYALDVADEIDEDAGPMGAAFVDCIVIDENTVVFTFEEAEGVTEQGIISALKSHGTVEVLAIPGDAISESETTDLFLAAVTIPAERLEGVSEATDDDTDEPIDEAEMKTICGHECFESAVKVA